MFLSFKAVVYALGALGCKETVVALVDVGEPPHEGGSSGVSKLAFLMSLLSH